MTQQRPDTPVCNLCGGSDFIDFAGRSRVRCTGCRSLERTRLLGLYLQRLSLRPNAKVLHIAPERNLGDLLKRRFPGVDYEPADFDLERYGATKNVRQIDLCRLNDEPSDAYDLILHSHVLEHTPCLLNHSFSHLNRMLCCGGRHVFIVPILSGYWDECFGPLPEDERVARFLQADHVRRFGKEDLGDSLGRLIDLGSAKDNVDLFGPEILRRHAIPRRCWTGLCAETIWDIEKV